MPEHDHGHLAARGTASSAIREPQLDGLRALAALAVLLFHCLSAVAVPSEVGAAQRRGPVGVLTNGASAVIVFFVLSGYVLTGSLLRQADMSQADVRGAAAFVARRLFRLYPAYLAALALAWLAGWGHPHLHYGAGVGQSMQRSAAVHLGAVELLVSALVPGTAYGQLPPGWTLTIELLLSLALPLMVLVALRFHVGTLVAAGALGLVVSDQRLVQFAFPFVLGVAIRVHGDAAARPGRLRSHGAAAAAFWAGVAALALPPVWLWPISSALGIAVASLGAASVLWLLPERPPIAALLSRPVLVGIGEASCGFYLLHFPVLCLVVPLVLGDEPAADATTAIARWLTLAAIVLPVSLILALASYRWIEAPAIAAGRRFSRRIAAGPRAAADPSR